MLVDMYMWWTGDMYTADYDWDLPTISRQGSLQVVFITDFVDNNCKNKRLINFTGKHLPCDELIFILPLLDFMIL